MPTPDSFDPERYGRSFAEVYDAWYEGAFPTEECVAALRALAGEGPVLELGVGTGRLAIPLAHAGLEVVGIDSSAEMLEKLSHHDPEQTVDVRWGDMARVDQLPDIDKQYTLAFCAFNTILNLGSADAIVECLQRTAKIVHPHGIIALEAFVPGDIENLPLRSLSPARVNSDQPVFIETTLDRSTRQLHGRHITVGRATVDVRPWSVVVLAPTELDELAQRAGLSLLERWSDWSASPFTDHSTSHISLFGHDKT